jgi:hypothetical protein
VGWEQRNGRGCYYTRTRRVNGRFVRQYFGAGPAGHLAAAEDGLKRESRRREAEEGQRLRDADRALSSFCGQVERLARAALVVAGYHRHHRCEWRRKMITTTTGDDRVSQTSGTDPVETEPAGPRYMPEEEVRELLARAATGDTSVLPELRRCLDADPDTWQRYGDVARQEEDDWLESMYGADLMAQECARRKLRQLRDELAGPGAGPVERLLAEAAAACWLQARQAGRLVARADRAVTSVALLGYLQKRQTAAQRRELQALRSLVVVRKLLRPAPSPLDLASRQVPETAGDAASRRARGTSPAKGVALVN